MLALLKFISFLGRVRIGGTFVRNHVIIILLNLLITHDLIQLHLAVGELARVNLLVLRLIVTHVLHVVHFNLGTLLTIHVVVLSLTVLARRF